MKIYVASSWRNPWQPETVKILRASGHEVYDFRMGSWDGNPHDHGFSWREIDEHWHEWTPAQYRKNLSHPASERGFKSDMDALFGTKTSTWTKPSCVPSLQPTRS